MHRFRDWDIRLAAYLETVRTRVFEWGSHDCCLFSGNAIEAMTGEDPMPEFRGRYSTAVGAARSLQKFGAGTLERTVDAKFQRVAAPLAHRGDLVMSDGLLGICLGASMVAVGVVVSTDGPVREGLLRIDRRRWVSPLAWRVPYES